MFSTYGLKAADRQMTTRLRSAVEYGQIYIFFKLQCTVFAVVWFPSVCPSVTFVHSIHMAEDIVKLHYRPGSPIILAFWPQSPEPNSKGNLFSGGTKYNGGEKILWFSTEISIYLRNGTR